MSFSVIPMLGISLLLITAISFFTIDKWYERMMAITAITGTVLLCLIQLFSDVALNQVPTQALIFGAALSCALQGKNINANHSTVRIALLCATIVVIVTAFAQIAIARK